MQCGLASSWECQVAQSCQVRPKEGQEPSWGTEKGRTLTMLMLPHTVISRAQSDEIKLESRPLSARPPPPSHSRSVSTRRHTAAATAPRTSTPRCSACQKYWLTHTACASVTCLGLG